MPQAPFAESANHRERAVEVLAQCELAQACSPYTREAILRSARIEHHANREQVHSFGQTMVDLVLILHGIMEVSHTGAAGKRHVNAYLPAGTVFGLIPMIDAKGCTHDTWARGPLTVMRIPGTTIRHCMATDPVFQHAVMQDLCDCARAMFSSMRQRALLSLRARTAWTLCSLADQHGFRRDNRRKLNIKLSQDGLAELLGVTRQSTNRELRQFERDGVVQLGVSELELLDLEALRQASEGRR